MRLIGFNGIVERLVHIPKTKVYMPHVAQESGYGVVGGWFLATSAVKLLQGLQGVLKRPQSVLKVALFIPCS
jgi:hypothetical protein